MSDRIPSLRAWGPVLAAALVVAASVSGTAAQAPPDTVIARILAERVAAGRSAGIVVGVIDADGGRRIVAHGQERPGHALDGESIFEIGSITKVFTAIVLADMVARGEVSLDDPVARYLPDGVRVPARNGRKITLLDLATQSSGLPRLPTNLRITNFADPYADYGVEHLYEFLAGYELPRDPGERYEYTNLGMGLLGHALSLRAGLDFEALVRERILGPLGMASTAVTLTPALESRLAAGHNALGQPVPLWHMPTLAGAGALRSTVTDMLRFLAANIEGAGPLGDAMRATHEPRVEAGPPRLRVGMAWHRLRVEDSEIVWHNGGTGGYRSFMGFDPVKRVGVVVLSNSNQGVDDIGFHLVEARVPLRAPPGPAPARAPEW